MISSIYQFRKVTAKTNDMMYGLISLIRIDTPNLTNSEAAIQRCSKRCSENMQEIYRRTLTLDGCFCQLTSPIRNIYLFLTISPVTKEKDTVKDKR